VDVWTKERSLSPLQNRNTISRSSSRWPSHSKRL